MEGKVPPSLAMEQLGSREHLQTPEVSSWQPGLAHIRFWWGWEGKHLVRYHTPMYTHTLWLNSYNNL